MKRITIIFMLCVPATGFTQSCPCDTTNEIKAMKLLASILSNHPWDTAQSLDKWEGITFNSEGCVTSITMSNKMLEGHFPTGTLGELHCIQSIDFAANNIVGPIPPDLDNLMLLESLDLSSNRLSTPIPVTLTKLSNLVSLRLNNNLLSGTIPEELGNLSLLRELFLGSNELEGPIPNSLVKLINLTAIDLSNNSFTGQLPKYFQDLDLLSFRINDNQFQDTAWINFFSLFGTVVDISNNNFSYLSDITFTTIRKEKFKVFGNKLTFDDILPNIQLFSGIFIGSIESERYSPQQNFRKDTTLIFENNTPPVIDLSIDKDISGSTYKWYKNNQEIFTGDKPMLNLNSLFNSPDQYEGEYKCEVTNSFVPDLELRSGRIEVQLNFTTPQTAFTPAAFTPNSDGINDYFVIPALQGGNYQQNELIIFNRQREIVYRKSNYNNQWDGTNLNSGPLPQGTYYYLFKSDNYQESGLITLIRSL